MLVALAKHGASSEREAAAGALQVLSGIGVFLVAWERKATGTEVDSGARG